jgi:hypothetical protein
MLNFSDDPTLAERQMHAIIFYLTTFGYIDGDFDEREKAFVRGYIGQLVDHRATAAMGDDDSGARREVIEKYTKHFLEVFEGVDQSVKELFTEAVSDSEHQNDFVHAKLKVRCFEIFESFERGDQEQLMETVDALIMADGDVHPAEAQFRAELAALLEAESGIELADDAVSVRAVRLLAPSELRASGSDHPFFAPTEFHYSANPARIAEQIAGDRALLDRVTGIWNDQRAAGAGKLAGKHNVGEFDGEAPFLDGHIYVMPTKPGQRYALTVLGDLHGCYSILKATLMQSRFFERVDAFRADPRNNPEPRLILLGDYIDRGMFSLNGVLRSVLQLLATAPEFVYVLRGNHEYYIEHKGHMYGGVKPAEAINTLKPHLPIDVFRHYSATFEQMPSALLVGRTLFVHGGIARDLLLKERYKDLSSLNDPDIRFQMMWSDPSTADVIPAYLQEKSARFAFGRLQFKAFMQRIGCTAMVRGHEKVNEGFARVYDDPQAELFTLFSSGGSDNDDLPPGSSYRSVSPKVLTVFIDEAGAVTFAPWAPDYRTYNDPERNAFFKAPPEIAHKVD